MEHEAGVGPPKSRNAGPIRWLSSWQVQVFFAIFFCFSLPKVLSSSVPLSAVVYPGFFIAPPIWLAVAHFAGWDENRRPVVMVIPLALYLVGATVLMFVLYVTRDNSFYLNDGLVSMLFSVPAGLVAAALIWKRNDPRLHPPSPDMTGH